ncbi:UBP1-associated protein like [Quillaja saponaria]|uniref:UBP1-associated protein like n=1 Tax=Quillaja saponaria TaxID=32244 RepID=A0AAD7P7X1_QUISA|nr:UBP1-associated protein like [Quillaja saponaria]
MAKITETKKRRLVKHSEKKPKQQKLQKSLATTPKKQKQNPPSDCDSDSDSDKLPNLLEPYSKDQLIEILCNAALKDSAVLNLIRIAADRDVSHRKIFVHGLGWDTTRDTLVSAFESFGEIDDCNVVKDKNTGKAKGYGFVLFKTRKSAIKALKDPKKKIDNRMASCQLASVGPVSQPSQSQDTAGRKIYVSNVPPDVDAEKLRLFFGKFGEIESGPIGFDMHTGKSRGYALFVYKTLEGAKNTLLEPYKIFEGHQLHCQKAADGKNKNLMQPVQSQTQVQDPVLAAVAAAQNLALYGPRLNPVYAGLLTNPGAGFLATPGSMNQAFMAGALNHGAIPTGLSGSVGGLVSTGLSGYSGASHGLGSLGARTPSVLGAYGSGAAPLQGLQHFYSNTHIGQSSSGRDQGAVTGYPSYM